MNQGKPVIVQVFGKVIPVSYSIKGLPPGYISSFGRIGYYIPCLFKELVASPA